MRDCLLRTSTTGYIWFFVTLRQTLKELGTKHKKRSFGVFYSDSLQCIAHTWITLYLQCSSAQRKKRWNFEICMAFIADELAGNSRSQKEFLFSTSYSVLKQQQLIPARPLVSNISEIFIALVLDGWTKNSTHEEHTHVRFVHFQIFCCRKAVSENPETNQLWTCLCNRHAKQGAWKENNCCSQITQSPAFHHIICEWNLTLRKRTPLFCFLCGFGQMNLSNFAQDSCTETKTNPRFVVHHALEMCSFFLIFQTGTPESQWPAFLNFICFRSLRSNRRRLDQAAVIPGVFSKQKRPHHLHNDLKISNNHCGRRWWQWLKANLCAKQGALMHQRGMRLHPWFHNNRCGTQTKFYSKGDLLLGLRHESNYLGLTTSQKNWSFEVVGHVKKNTMFLWCPCPLFKYHWFHLHLACIHHWVTET